MYHITNYVTVTDTCCKHNLTKIVQDFKAGSFRPDEYSALTVKSVHPNCTMIMFASGNLTIMGATSKFNSLNRILDLKEKYNILCKNIRVTNIVCTSQLVDYEIDLMKIYKKWPQYCVYDPNLFPGCTVNIPDTCMKVNLFSSGKVVLSGGTNNETIQNGLQFVYNLILDVKI